MLIILAFILGAIAAVVFYPLLSGISDWILTFIEYRKAKIGLKITQCNVEMDKARCEKNPPARQIGFCIPSTEEEEAYEDDD